jgi:2-amino-4-hydroxy-6-hydroxymethyldihydropteridine diphosphokinase
LRLARPADEPVEVLLGLGANLGDPLDQLRTAVRFLAERMDVLSVSPVYRSEPVGGIGQPEYRNLVVRARTTLPARDLLHLVHEVERSMGRERSTRDAPRTMDVDILTYGPYRLSDPDLEVPHPRMHERAFVLRPLNDVAPEWRHPVLGLSAAELLARGTGWERVERLDQPEGSS